MSRIVSYTGWVKKQDVVLSEYVNELRRQEECEQIRTSTEKTKHCLIFLREIFYATIVLCLNTIWPKAVNEITARQTWTSLRKHDVIKPSSIEYLTTQIELVLPTFFQLLDRSQNYRITSVRTIVHPLKYLSQYNSLLFLAHHVHLSADVLTIRYSLVKYIIGLPHLFDFRPAENST